jgi:hypothetical protein
LTISENKFVIEIGPLAFLDGHKEWVTVIFHGTGQRWVPSFEDLFRIVTALGTCEDRKYPDGEGRWMIGRFVAACLAAEDGDWDQVRRQFQIPDRTLA